MRAGDGICLPDVAISLGEDWDNKICPFYFGITGEWLLLHVTSSTAWLSTSLVLQNLARFG